MKHKTPGRAFSHDYARPVGKADDAELARNGSRTRPTNNQLLYKAYFRWSHYPFKLRNGTNHLPTETDSCASVTSAFLQVLHALHVAEESRTALKRNILQMLSTNTRRTKVVELSTGTHRVPDELKKHYLSDGEDGQYSTNLDRNRYGNDDQYLFTVVRYDLEFLGFCPCIVDVEIIDAKNNNQSISVSAGPESCTCVKDSMGPPRDEPAPVSNNVSKGLPTGPSSKNDSPKRSASGVSQLFDALVMAATGGTEDAAAVGLGGEPPVTSKMGFESKFGTLDGKQQQGERPQHALPARQRSRLWSALSYGDVDSLQNALDAFRAEDEIVSGPNLSEALHSGEGSLRKRNRKPLRPSSSLLGLDSSFLGSMMKSTSGLKEKSDENAKGDVISSGAQNLQPSSTVGSQEDDSEPPNILQDDDPDHQHPPRRVRHVPRQSSAVNLTTRTAPAELKRLTAEIESLRNENRRLQLQVRDQANISNFDDGDRARVRALEQEMLRMRQEFQQLAAAKASAEAAKALAEAAKAAAEEQSMKLSAELSSTKSTTEQVLATFAPFFGINGGHAAMLYPGFSTLPMMAGSKVMNPLQQLQSGISSAVAGVPKRIIDEAAKAEISAKRQHLDPEVNVTSANGSYDAMAAFLASAAAGKEVFGVKQEI